MDIHIGIGSFRRSEIHSHRSNTQDREWVCRPDIHTGTLTLRNRKGALTVEIHSASSGCGSGYPPPEPTLSSGLARTLTVENHSTSSDFERRISTRTRIRESAGEVRFRGPRRPEVHAGIGTLSNRASTLTFEIHSAASHLAGRISTRESALPSIAYSLPRPKCAALQTTLSAERLRLDRLSADGALTLTIELHSASSRLRRLIRAMKSARCGPLTRAHR